MKRGIFLLFCLALSLVICGQEKMYIHKSDNMTLGALISKTDSIFFSNDGSVVYFRIEGNIAQYLVSSIDSILFGDNSGTVEISYNGSRVTVVNPLAFEGVTVAVSGADVTVTSTIEDQKVNYLLSGTTSDGMFKIYSNYKFGIEMSSVNITNADGPAINIQSGKKCTVTLDAGSSNSLTDGATYASGSENLKGAFFSEGQMEFEGTGSLSVRSISNHAICSDDYIEILNGSITITGAGKDGIHTVDYFSVTGGTLNITATGDGVDCENGYIQVTGGTITTFNPAADVNGMVSDSILIVSGGTINMTVGGTQSKGLKSGRLMTLSGGTITINTSGGVALLSSGSGYNPTYCCGIKGDQGIAISGSNITIKCTGIAGKGISCDANITMTAGNVNISTTGNGATYKNSNGIADSYNATCLTADGSISLLGGSVTASSSGTGGKGITLNGTLTIGDSNNSPVISVTTSGTKFVESGSGQNAEYNEPKAIKSDGAILFANGNISVSSNDDAIKSEKSVTFSNAKVTISKCIEGIEAPSLTVNSGEISLTGTNDGFNATKGNGGESNDGSLLTINGGYIVTNVSNGDGLDSNGSMIMTGGTVLVHGPQSQPEVGMDFNGTFNVSGGLLVVSGTNSNMTEGPSTSSGQYSVMAKTNTGYNAIFHMEDAGGNNILTFKPVRTFYSMVVSSSGLKSGSSCKIYTGGTSTGTLKDGLYTGGAYSGGTLKKTFTVSGKLTSVSF